jgi:hypothetical protein
MEISLLPTAVSPRTETIEQAGPCITYEIRINDVNATAMEEFPMGRSRRAI